MRTSIIALLLVSAPMATSLLMPAASAECVTGSDNPNGSTTTVFSAGNPDIGIWIENGCYPFTTHDGTQDQGTVTAQYDGRKEQPRCQHVLRVEVFILGVVPGTDTTHCTPNSQLYESRSVSYGPVADLGVVACSIVVNSCLWVTPRYTVFLCMLAGPNAVGFSPVPGTSDSTASVGCTVS